MDYELVKSEILRYDNKRGTLSIDYKPADIFDAGDVVRALLKYTSDVLVKWEDDGDVGMKDGGSCRGQEFVYTGMINAWGGCYYTIEAKYNGTDMMFNTYTDEQNVPSCTVQAVVHFGNIEEVSEEQLKELQDVTIPKLLGWISDPEATEQSVEESFYAVNENEDSDGYRGFHFHNRYVIRENAAFETVIQEIIKKVEDKKLKLPEWKQSDEIWILMESKEDFEKVRTDRRLKGFCRSNNIHVLSGKWARHYDLYDDTEYYFTYESGWGSADDAETYTECYREKVIGGDRQVFTTELAEGCNYDKEITGTNAYRSICRNVKRCLETDLCWHYFDESELPNKRKENPWEFPGGFDWLWLNPGADILNVVKDYITITDLCKKLKAQNIWGFINGRLMLLCDEQQINLPKEKYEELAALCKEKSINPVKLEANGEFTSYLTGQRWKFAYTGVTRCQNHEYDKIGLVEVKKDSEKGDKNRLQTG